MNIFIQYISLCGLLLALAGVAYTSISCASICRMRKENMKLSTYLKGRLFYDMCKEPLDTSGEITMPAFSDECGYVIKKTAIQECMVKEGGI